jgi:hypothetical protein
MNRREFTAEVALLLLGGATITLSGCGGGGSPAASSPPLTDKAGEISSNHGHAATVTAAQLGTGGGLDLDIQGTASHSHMLSLTAGEVVMIRSGSRFEKTCTGGKHTHTVTFNA